MDSGHTAWMLTASALVLLMTPGLAFFYGGLVRARNVISTIMYSFISMAVVSIVWVLWGYSLAFGTGSEVIGDFSFVGLKDIAIDEVFPGTGIPTLLFVIFQMMFAIITPALITGAFVERFKFTTYLLFLVIWVTIVYAPVAHWVWGGGWLADVGDGALDFAGGTVVHINAGLAAVAAAILVGKRRSPGVEPHNVPYVVLGAGLLWFGWFGFNAGSGLAANAVDVNAFLVTNTAAATAALTWGLLSQIQSGRMSAVGVASGAVAGLVAITPASGYVGVMGGLAIGFGAGGLCYGAVYLRSKTGLDDALEVFAVHGVGGIWGAIATGIFAVAAIGGTAGWIEGNGGQMLTQIIAVVATGAYSFVATVIILKVLDLIPGLGLRVEANEEDEGLDLSAHGERAFVGDGAN
ncbi:MAG: ammonia channel protein [Chloroflexi bacterium]|nr:ammonia channel protein [Chloroflexota bacterium]MDP6421698.1 ammonium transporter [SAR202 cluster bacterium]HAL46729.1 ammonia channel protein [Dehalococcoidia bacterium]MDP6664298.1 ammonium transporter [SAR202 cluster bacterium]MDP6801014.1 ammonium transporter [SAR202 cluster bacterium]